MRKLMIALICLVMVGPAWAGVGTLGGSLWIKLNPTYKIQAIVLGDRYQENCSGTWTPRDGNWVIMCPAYRGYPSVIWDGVNQDTTLRTYEDNFVYRKWGNLHTWWGGDW